MNGIYALVFGIITLMVAFVRALRSLLYVLFSMNTAKNAKWFKPFGWFYRPVAVPGYVIFFLMFLFCLHIIIATTVRSHSLADVLYGVFPFIIPAVGVYLWVASKTS